jgi:hypothetical protein
MAPRTGGRSARPPASPRTALAAAVLGHRSCALSYEHERRRVLIARFDAPRLGPSGDLSAIGAMARLLLDAGAPIDAGDPDWHRQALRVAAQHGRPASVRHLLARGADPAPLTP